MLVGEVRNELKVHAGAEITVYSGPLPRETRFYAFDIGRENEVSFYGAPVLIAFLREAKRVLQEDGVAEVDLW